MTECETFLKVASNWFSHVETASEMAIVVTKESLGQNLEILDEKLHDLKVPMILNHNAT